MDCRECRKRHTCDSYESYKKQPNLIMMSCSEFEYDSYAASNADIIRAKSNMELAEFMADVSVKQVLSTNLGDISAYTPIQTAALKDTLTHLWLVWLMRPAEEK